MFTSVNARSANAYKRVGVESVVSTANPHHLIEMLFDGLISNLGTAKVAMLKKDIKTKCVHIGTAVRILEEGLKGSLNLQEGGSLAENLEGIYDYCVLRLTQANLRNDVSLIEEVVSIISQVSDGWKQIGEQVSPQRTM